MAIPYVELKNITKTYPQTIALQDVSLSFNAGEIHGILGENGVGKTTLMKIMYGILTPDSGQILVEGQTVRCDWRPPVGSLHKTRNKSLHNSKNIDLHNISMVHQHSALIPEMTVTENVILGNPAWRRGFVRRRAIAGKIAKVGQKYGIFVRPQEKICHLSPGEKQRAEILMALMGSCKLLILDEPTAVLGAQEVRNLFGVLRQLAASGVAVVIISHKIRELMALCDCISVLRQGRLAAQTVYMRESVTENALAALMTGAGEAKCLPQYAADLPKQTGKKDPGGEVLRLDHLSVSGGHLAVKDISLCIHGGEIYGIAGVDGNGQGELVRGILGMLPKCGHGLVFLQGKDISAASAKDILGDGVAYIPQDCQAQGIVAEMSLEENLVLNVYRQPRFGKGPVLSAKAVRKHALQSMLDGDIRAASARQKASTLSGGNQQKLVLARELSKDAGLLIAVQPTRGLDMRAAVRVHRQILRMRQNGAAVLLISADLDEILTLADHIGVMYEGRLIADFENIRTEDALLAAAESLKEKIGLAMAGKDGNAYDRKDSTAGKG